MPATAGGPDHRRRPVAGDIVVGGPTGLSSVPFPFLLSVCVVARDAGACTCLPLTVWSFVGRGGGNPSVIFLLFLSLLLAHRRHGPAWTLIDARGRGGVDTRCASRDGDARGRVANPRLGARGSLPRPCFFGCVCPVSLNRLFTRSLCTRLFSLSVCPRPFLLSHCGVLHLSWSLATKFFMIFFSPAQPQCSRASLGPATQGGATPHKTKQKNPTTKTGTVCGGRPAATRVAHERPAPPRPPRAETRTDAPRGSAAHGDPSGRPPGQPRAGETPKDTTARH